MDFIKSDRTLAVGDFVFSSYHKKDYLFKITKIERRFINAVDLSWVDDKGVSRIYPHGKVGDEKDPVMTIEAIANLSISADKGKFRKTTAGLDAIYLKRATPEMIDAHIKRLSKLLDDLWP